MNRSFSLMIFVFVLSLLSFSVFRLRESVPIDPIRSTRRDKPGQYFELVDKQPRINNGFPLPEILLSGSSRNIEFSIENFRFLPWGLDLNRAGPDLLTIIRGIGPSAAERIVLDRNHNGRFTSLSDFCLRSKIKPEKLEYCKKWIYVGE